MKTVCSGYWDKNNKLIKCGKVIKRGQAKPISHGICAKCWAKQKELIQRLFKKGGGE